MRGTLLNERYRLDEPLGSEGAGAVWRATDLRLDRTIAVKLLHGAASMDDTAAQARFQREAKITARLSGHPHIVPVHDYGHYRDPHDRNIPYVVMEHITGPSLKDEIAAPSALPVTRVVDWAAQICDALTASHECGIIHRDIKPANVMLTRPGNGTIKVVAFGIAAYIDGDHTRLTTEGRLIGSPAYMAPEQAKPGALLDARTDLYSLGCLLYTLLTGRPPFTVDGYWPLLMAHFTTEPDPPGTHRPDLPPALNQLVLDLLAKDPDNRPTTAAMVRQRLTTTHTTTPNDLRPSHNDAADPGKAGGHAEAARRWEQIAKDRARVLGPDHPATLDSRHNHAVNLGRSGARAETVRLLEQLAKDYARVHGPDHSDTLSSRHSHAVNLGEAGEREPPRVRWRL